MIRSGYSFRLAVGHVTEVVKRIKEVGWEAAPISDRGGTFGFVTWSKECAAQGIRPVYGVELAVSADRTTKRPILDHWTFLAKGKVGDLHNLIGMATEQSTGEPILSYDQAMNAEGVFKIAHECCLIEHVDFSKPDLFMALTPATSIALYRKAEKAGAKFVAMPRNLYPQESDLELYRIMIHRKAGTQTYPQHIVSDDELRESQPFISPDWNLAFGNRHKILYACTAELEKARLLKYESDKTLRQLCEEGAAKLGVDLFNNVYQERLEKELGLIEEKNFTDYFFIIADLVAWAKKEMVVGPARGSSCGSLVCYLTGITAIDPIPHGLIFERFIDITRADLPDIDLDFSDAHRDRVMEYAEQKYGDRVARLGSVGIYQPRSALNRIGAALKIPSWQVSKVAETAIKRAMGDSRKSSTIEDTLFETDAGRDMIKEFPEAKVVARFEGHPDYAGIHAAGLVVTDKPVSTYVAIDRRSHTAMCNKKDSEALNLLKIDVLGLTQLSIFERCMKLIGREPVSGWLETIPMDDQAAFDLLNSHKYCGIFQFTGHAMKSLAQQITFESMDDIIAATALVRPGPLSSGGTDLWIKRRHGYAPVTYPHPLLEEYLKETYGVPVYQEQILRIGREVGDLSWADVTKLRQAMSKSLGKQYFDQFGDRWKEAAIGKGMPKEVAEKFWDAMCQFGAWAFNKAHSVSYAYVSYWCAYLKARHPLEFAAATLDAEKEPDKQIEILRELKAEGIDYIPVDPDRSTDHWEILDESKLLGPLTNIKNIGPAKVKMILSKRAAQLSLPLGTAKLLNAPKTAIDSLYPIRDRVRALYPRGLEEKFIFTKPTEVNDIQPGVGTGKVIIVVATRLIPKDENEPVKVAKRGYELKGPTTALNMFVKDDTGECFAKVDRFKYEAIGRDIQKKGRVGEIIYCLKGDVPRTFRMLSIEGARELGEMD